MMRPSLYRPPRNWSARLREYDLVGGLRAVFLENELLRVGFLADRGTDLIELLYKPRDLDFAWLSAGGIREAAAPGVCDPLGSFLDTYPGGWQEVLPNGGAPSSHAGATYGQHGEISLVPWDYELLEDGEDAVAVRFAVTGRKAPFRLTKEVRLRAGEPSFSINEVLCNESDVSVQVMWGHHITFGPPFLEPGCRVELADGVEAIAHETPLNEGGRRVRADRFPWPRAKNEADADVSLDVIPEHGEPSELLYLTNFGDGRYEIVRPASRLGLRVEWDAKVMPYLWFWQEFGRTIDYPWYGRHYNVGLEPFTSYPTNGLAEAVANGTALELPPRGRRDFWLTATVVDE
jgi:Domain of unknown function (DUF4432)